MGLLYAGLNRSPEETQLRLLLLAGLCGVTMLLLGSLKEEAGAAEWSADPSIGVKGEYNSNLLLFNGNNEVYGYWVNPGVKFKGSTEALDVAGEVKAQVVHYYGDQEREYTNLYFPLKTSYRADRYTVGFEGGYTRDNTLQSELQQTGLVLGFTQRSLWSAMPSFTVGLTERLSWKNGYQFTDAQYEDGIRFGLVNYQVQAGTTGLSYNLGELDQVQLTGEYTSFRVPSRMQESNYYGVQAGWTRDFGHEVTGSISGGVRFVTGTQDISGGSLSAHDTVWVYKGTLRKRFERSTIQIDGGSQVNPSGFGRLLQTDRVGGTLSHELTETLTVLLNGNIYFVSGVVNDPSIASTPVQRYSSISPSLSWKFSQWWTLDVAYTYSERAVDSLNQWNFSNSTYVMVTYGGPKWSVSR